jgi:hypothetical protein
MFWSQITYLNSSHMHKEGVLYYSDLVEYKTHSWWEWNLSVLNHNTIYWSIIFKNRFKITFLTFLYKVNQMWNIFRSTKVISQPNSPTQNRPPDFRLLSKDPLEPTICANIACFSCRQGHYRQNLISILSSIGQTARVYIHTIRGWRRTGPTAQVRVRARFRPCAICDKQSGPGTGLAEFFDFPLSILFLRGSTYLDDRAIEVRSPVEAKGFSLYLLCPDRLWGPRSLLYNGYRKSFLWRAAGAWWPRH